MRKSPRREFLRRMLQAGAGSLVQVTDASGQAHQQVEEANAQGRLILSNRFLDYEIELVGGPKLLGWRNKFTGRYTSVKQAYPCLLRLSTSEHRVDIPSWKFQTGSLSRQTSPEQDAGYRNRYFAPETDDQNWTDVLDLYGNVPSAGEGLFPPNYDGYGWFRAWFDLPDTGRAMDIYIVLGGYDRLDWREYLFVSVNGQRVSGDLAERSGGSPAIYRLSPGTREYGALLFGRRNMLSVQTWGLRRIPPGNAGTTPYKYRFRSMLSDQFVSVGPPYLEVRDFDLRDHQLRRAREETRADFRLSNSQHGFQVDITYVISQNQPVCRKITKIKNLSDREHLLLDVELDGWEADEPLHEGGQGYPIFVGDGEAFCSVEHPAAANHRRLAAVHLLHFPGRVLKPGDSMESPPVVMGVSPAGGAAKYFEQYLAQRMRRSRRMVTLYESYGLNDYVFSADPKERDLTEQKARVGLDTLRRWRKEGYGVQYFANSLGFQDHASAVLSYRRDIWPDGPEKFISDLEREGMQYGTWFATTMADWSNGANPNTASSRVPFPGVSWVPEKTRMGATVWDFGRRLCLASEPYGKMFLEALRYHVRKYRARLIKLDEASFGCNSTEHDHLPGKYSSEANMNRIIHIMETIIREEPSIFFLLYWGYYSPWWCLYANTVNDVSINIEGSNASEFPSLFFRDSVNVSLDQAAQAASLVPPLAKDSLGLYLADNLWGNWMGAERWRETWIMDLGRGNLISQFWGGIASFTHADVALLARVSRLVADNLTMFRNRHDLFGNPWKGDVYGYGYAEKTHGLLFVNNPSFQARPVRLRLGADIGLDGLGQEPLRIFCHYPEQAEFFREGGRVFRLGDELNFWLRPFEVTVLEVVPVKQSPSRPGHTRKIWPEDVPEIQSQQLTADVEQGPTLTLDASNSAKASSPTELVSPTLATAPLRFVVGPGVLEQRSWRLRLKLPHVKGDEILALVLTVFLNSEPWWSESLSQDFGFQLFVDGKEVKTESVPVRGKPCWKGTPWLSIKAMVDPSWSGAEAVISVTAVLPNRIAVQQKAYLVPKWWT